MKKILKWGCIIFFVIPIILGIIFSFFTDEFEIDETITNEPKKEIQKEIPTQKKQTKSNASTILTLDYSVLPIEKIGLKTQNRATQKIIVKSSEKQPEEILKQTALKHWKVNSYKMYDELTIYIFLNNMNTSNRPYSIVELDKNGKITQFVINEFFTDPIEENDLVDIEIEEESKKDENPLIFEVYNTFDVDYKIQAFIDIINIEGRAMYEAMQKYPDPKNWQSELEYQRKIKAKYELKWYKKQSWWKKIKKDVKSADKIKFKIVGYMMKRNWLNKFENDPRRIKYKGIDF